MDLTDRSNLEDFLEYLITPQDSGEQKLFRSEGLVDDYIEIKSRISSMTKKELIDEINHQLSPYHLSIAQSNNNK